jgi:hypothetical protein
MMTLIENNVIPYSILQLSDAFRALAPRRPATDGTFRRRGSHNVT